MPSPRWTPWAYLTRELESALRRGEIDVAVHSLKDLPTIQRDGLTVGAICVRDDARDVLISNGVAFDALPAGARVGTSSPGELRKFGPFGRTCLRSQCVATSKRDWIRCVGVNLTRQSWPLRDFTGCTLNQRLQNTSRSIR